MQTFKTIRHTIILVLLVILFVPFLALAENPAIKELQDIGSTQGPYQPATALSLSTGIGFIIQGALALIGAIFLILMLYAGYHWMTARGEEEKVEKAKDTITRAIIGIIIVVGAYAIWAFVFAQLF